MRADMLTDVTALEQVWTAKAADGVRGSKGVLAEIRCQRARCCRPRRKAKGGLYVCYGTTNTGTLPSARTSDV